MGKKRFLAVAGACALVGLSLSGAIHETGHVLVAKLAGLQIVGIQPWFFLGRAHVQFRGTTTAGWSAAIHAAGGLASVVAGLAGLVIVCRLVRRNPSCIVSALLFVPMVCQSLAWVVLPVVLAMGAPAPHDDITEFIRLSQWGYFTVALFGVAPALLSAVLILRICRTWQSSRCDRPPRSCAT